MYEVQSDNEKRASAAEPSVKAASKPLRPWLKMAGLVIGTAGSLTLLIGAATYQLSSILIRPRLKRLPHLKRPHLRSLMRRIGIAFEDIVIESFDRTKLYGWWMQKSADAPTVVVLHGVNNNRTSVIRASLVLRQAGFNVLVFDGRAHGDSEGRYVTYGFYERRDVETVIEWLIAEKGIDKERIGLAGESMGAAIALQVAAQLPWIRAVWADSPFASLRRVTGEYVRRVTGLPEAVISPVLWSVIRVANYRGKFDVEQVSPLALADRIKCPVFLVHGTDDDLIEVQHSENIHDALPGKKELWIVEGVTHARSARRAKREYGDRLTGFFGEHLKK
ncbi:MAG: alpha/beta fold hydrolase [Blastocatellia bacterium]|nr:alpha/beta fold hydrolase [Blastocatellia bacterium]